MKRRNFLTMLAAGVMAAGIGVKNTILKSEKRVWYIVGESVNQIEWKEIRKDMQIYIEELTDCNHGDAVLWNPYNKAFQCHRCGQQMDGPYITKSDGFFLGDKKVWSVELVKKDSQIGKFRKV